MVIQPALLLDVQSHPLAAVTLTVSDSPEGPTAFRVGETA
jgi:hypothetical protein